MLITNIGCDFFTLYYNDFVKIKEEDLNKNGITCIKEYTNGPAVKPVCQKITPANIGRFFKKEYTWELFVADLLKLKDEFVKNKMEELKNRSVASMALNSLKEGGEEFRTKKVELFTQAKFMNQFTDADDEFVYNKTFRDEQNNLYMKLNSILYHLRFKQGTDRTLMGNSTEKDYQLWPSFWAENKENFNKWQETIISVIDGYDPKCGKSIEECIMDSGVPRIFLECLAVQISQIGTTTTDDKGKEHKNWYYAGCNVLLDNGSNSTWQLDNVIEVFSKKLLTSVDANKLKTIKRYSNDMDEIAVHNIYRPLPVLHKTEPKLPPTWDMFFGNGRFFDPHMDKLKIAHFIDNTINADYDGRQTLVIGGEGDDGKGTFVNILQDIVGRDLTTSMNVYDFSPEDRFGLAKIFNKKLLLIPDCKQVTTLFGQDKFKSVTGSDPVTLENKGQKSVEFDTKGICICMTTNKSFYVNSEHGRTRVMPLMFLKNFSEKDQLDKSVLYNKLLAEKKEFVQWCVDYKNFYRENVPGLFNGNRLVMCCDEDVPNLDKLNAQELFKNMCEKQTIGQGNNRVKLCSWNEWSDAEEEQMENVSELLLNISKQMFGDCYLNLLTNKVKYKKYDAESDINENIIIGDNNELWYKSINLISKINAQLAADSSSLSPKFIPALKACRDKMSFKSNDKDWTKFIRDKLDFRQHVYVNKERKTSMVNIRGLFDTEIDTEIKSITQNINNSPKDDIDLYI